MAAFKRKRGAQASAEKKSKKVKFVADEGEAPAENNQEQKNVVTIPAPVSMVSAPSCFQRWKLSH